MPMRNEQVVTVRRTDYRPPAFLLDRVALEFDLDPALTHVTATLVVHRNPALPGQHRAAGARRRGPRTGIRGTRRARAAQCRLRTARRQPDDPGAGGPVHREDRQPHPSGGQHRTDGAVRLERQLLQPVRSRGLPPHHVLSRSSRRDGAVPRRAARRRRRSTRRCCRTAISSSRARSTTGATTPCGTTRSPSRAICSRSWPAASRCSKTASCGPAAARRCCRSTSSPATSRRPSTRWRA